MKCVRSDLQFWLIKWKSYVIDDWCASCEATVRTTKSWAKFFRNHFSWRFDTNLIMKFSKFQNYCDNESISVILATLKCIHSALQFWLNKWKSYMIVDWCARFEAIVRILAFKMSFDDWTKRVWWFIALKTWILNWWKLSNLKNTNAKLIRILPDRSFASSEFTEYFIIERFYISIKTAWNFFVSKNFTQNKCQIFHIFQNIIRFFKTRHFLNFSILKIEKNYFSININPNPTSQNHFHTFSMSNFSNLQKKLYHVKNSHNGATFKI